VLEAVVLAGGFGTRLRGVLSDTPKALAPVAGRPFLAYGLDLLAGGGVEHVVLATGYMAEQVEAAIGGCWGAMRISYSRESTPLGTGGALRQAAALTQDGPLLVLNGDTYLRFDPAAFVERMRELQAPIGIALAEVADVARYGVVETLGDRVHAFREKGDRGPGSINAGVYCLSAGAVAALPRSEAFSFEHEVLAPAVAAGQVFAWRATADFIDIGVPADYAAAQALAPGWSAGE
jgi:D-glycero-alpha-D-manno-heptose 1-phosphate guanylyltransferase